jgi:hypothetical protein
MAKLLSGTRIYGNATVDTFITVGTNVAAANVVITNASRLGNVTSGIWNGSSISTTYTDAKVTSVAGQTGAISNTQIASAVSATGILTTANVSEVTNLYFTNARSIAALTEGAGINIDANGLISAIATGGGGGTSNAFSVIRVSGQSNIIASGESTLSIAVDGLLAATTNNVTNTVTLSTTNKAFPFYDSSSTSKPIQLRVLDSIINQVLTTVYLPFTKSDGSSVTTLRIS